MNKFMTKFLKSSLFSSVGLVILGILLFFDYVKSMNKNERNELDIVYGIGMVVLGIIVISNPKGVASIIPFILGIIIILSSSAKLQYSLELRKVGNPLWKSTMILSLITLLFGLLLIFNPFKGAELITKVVGILLFLYGIIDIISTIRIKKTVEDIKKVIEDNSVPDAEVIEDKTKK